MNGLVVQTPDAVTLEITLARAGSKAGESELRFRFYDPHRMIRERVIPVVAFLDTWPLIQAALTLRGVQP